MTLYIIMDGKWFLDPDMERFESEDGNRFRNWDDLKRIYA